MISKNTRELSQVLGLLLLILTAFSCGVKKTQETKETIIKPKLTEEPKENTIKFDELTVAIWTFQYDEKGNKIEDVKHLSADSLEYRNIYKYDEQNHLIEERWLHSDGSLDRLFTYLYDKEGKQISQKGYREDKSLYETILYKYDNKGNKIEMDYYNPADVLFRKDSYKYNDKGYQTEWITSAFNGEQYLKRTYFYDKEGHKVKEFHYDKDGFFVKYLYLYDTKGNLNETREYIRERNQGYKWKYKYNNQGDIIEEILLKTDNTMFYRHTFDYLYDKQGNLVNKTEHNTL